MSAVYERVKRIVVEQLRVKENEVNYDASFVDDLGADSLDAVELVMALEEEFDCEIPDNEAEKMSKVRDAVSWIEDNCINRRKTLPNEPSRSVADKARVQRPLFSGLGTSRLNIPTAITPKKPQYVVCSGCNGTGWIYNPSLHQLAPYVGDPGKITCPTCNGAGKIPKLPS